MENVEFDIFFIKQTIKLYEDAIAKSKKIWNKIMSIDKNEKDMY